MWKPFNNENQVYLIRIIIDNGVYKMYLSDLTDLWSKSFSKDEVIERFKESNPIIVVEDEEAVSQTIKILNQIDNASITIETQDDKINLKIKSDALGISDTKFKLKYELELSKDDKSKFTEELTAPMIHTINYLERQQKMLCDLITKKDRELEEYKMEKGLISRTDLVTEKFDTSALITPTDKLMLNVFTESSKFWENFVNMYGNIEANVMEVKVDPWNQVKRKKKVYNANTSAKKFVKGITYKKE